MRHTNHTHTHTHTHSDTYVSSSDILNKVHCKGYPHIIYLAKWNNLIIFYFFFSELYELQMYCRKRSWQYIMGETRKMSVVQLWRTCQRCNSNEIGSKFFRWHSRYAHVCLPDEVKNSTWINRIVVMTLLPFYRSVAKEQKSLAIGIYLLITRVLAWIPGPLVYGALIDSTCLYWGKKPCTNRAYCKVWASALITSCRFAYTSMTVWIIFVLNARLPQETKECLRLAKGCKCRKFQ